MSEIHNNIEQIQQDIIRIATSCGRNPNEIQLLAVSKTHTPETVREAHQCGLTCFGENRVQEAESKIKDLSDLNLEWHLIGPLQTNKVKKSLALFHCIQTVDRLKLARTIEKEAAKLEKSIPVFIQVNVGREEQKSGIAIEELDEFVQELKTYQWMRCRGFMAIPPYFDNPEDVRTYFRELRELGERYKQELSQSGEKWGLSMGMTHDYPIAIEEGSTMIRVGTAIFGNRIVH